MPIAESVVSSNLEEDSLPVRDAPTPTPRILLVDDDDSFRELIAQVLRVKGFTVVETANVPGALKLIGSEDFDALLSDLHMPRPGDGLTVVSAMRHSHPKAITILMSAFPEMTEAAQAILRQTDEVLVKPLKIEAMVATIIERLNLGVAPAHAVESLASILEQETQATIEEWLRLVEAEPKIITVCMTPQQRIARLPQLFRDLVSRLRHPVPLGTRALLSPEAAMHGLMRREQGYTAAMMVEESRMLQVSIFQTLENNLHRIDFSLLLVGVMAIADEVESQLAQAMICYVAESKVDRKPVAA
jgi:CheY-like chemotaxis protein